MKKLRDAGAVILGKSNMHELASGITTISSIGGQTCNPYDPIGVRADRAAAAAPPSRRASRRSRGARTPADRFAFRRRCTTCSGCVRRRGCRASPASCRSRTRRTSAGRSRERVMDLAIGLDATVGADPADSATRILDGRAAAAIRRRARLHRRCAASDSAFSSRISARRPTIRRARASSARRSTR